MSGQPSGASEAGDRPRSAAARGECRLCRDRVAGCRERLRATRCELVEQREWLGARAVSVGAIVREIDLFLTEPHRHRTTWATLGIRGRGRTAPRASRPVPSLVKTVVRGDGSVDVHLEDAKPFRLSPLLGRLFVLLAQNAGHEVGDGLVGFKTTAHLVGALAAGALVAPSRRNILTARGLARAVQALRRCLSHLVPGGDALVQTRRGVGRRIALRKAPADGH